ncbi:hypothetical protein IWQ49_006752 [Labrenzia sp. EL_126]|nr:hypothetical protein [Labrenzia sp. EL_126]
MVFQEDLDLPTFAAFTLLNSEKRRATLDRYMMNFGRIDVRHHLGFIMDTPTGGPAADGPPNWVCQSRT